MDKKTVELFKGLAMVAVIIIHADTSFSIDKSLLVVDQVMRFSVPLFVALSGFGLAAKYNIVKFSLGDFCLRRVSKLLPWYILFATLFFFSWPHSLPFWKTIVWGEADYHLYFVPMIFQLYLLFPILWILVKKWPWPSLALSIGWQVIWFGKIAAMTDQQQYVHFSSWIAFFVLGIFLATKNLYERRLVKIGVVGMVLGGLGWVISNALGLANQGVDLLVATRFTRVPVVAYSFGVILLVFCFQGLLSRLPDFLIKILITCGEVSFVTYLLHTAVLRYFSETLGWAKIAAYQVFVPLVIVGSFTIAWVITRMASGFWKLVRPTMVI